MNISEITLAGFRNYKKEVFNFSPGLNVILGSNGQGKTNLLEAIGFLSVGRSFKSIKDLDLINYYEKNAYIKGVFNEKTHNTDIEAMITKTSKSFKINSFPIKRLGELFGNAMCVIFSPEDLRLIKDSPSVRRKFMDLEISKIRSSYYFDLQSYYNVLRQKNALLKSFAKPKPQTRDLITVYNEQLARYANEIIKRRKVFFAEINERLQNIYSKIAGNDETISIKYKPCADGDNIAQSLFDKLEHSFAQEMEFKTTLSGIHREDILFILNEKDAKTFASQGQQRSAIISLKLCVADIILKFTRINPIILLDDIFSELDLSRQQGLLNAVSNNQIIITSANITPDKNADVINISNGRRC